MTWYPRGLLLLARTRRLPWFALCLALACAASTVMPLTVRVWLNDFSADPRLAVWPLAGGMVSLTLSPRYDVSEGATEVGLPAIRARALGVAAVAGGLGSWIFGGHNTAAREVALRNFALGAALCLLCALVGSASLSGALVFAFVLATWVFGIEPLHREPRVWAVFLHEADLQALGSTLFLFFVVAGLWCRFGSRSD